MEFFTTMAEVSIAILAFTSIVTQFVSRNNPNWNKHIFQGMVSHCIQAFLYSSLPFLIQPFGAEYDLIWKISGWFLGVATFLQGILVMFADQVSKFNVKVLMLILSTLVFILQLLNIYEVFWKINEGPYLIGIFWHIFQALNIFMMFLFAKEEEM